jgi:hypothetical protein
MGCEYGGNCLWLLLTLLPPALYRMVLELSVTARRYYQRELEKRGPAESLPPSNPAGGEDVGIEPDWLDHAACACSFTAPPGVHSAPDAERARSVLLAAGVPCHISAVAPDPKDPDSGSYGEFRILVPASLNMKAMSILDKDVFNAELEAEWRTHLSMLTDEELAAVPPEVICAGFLDRARRLTQAYQDEVARRSL